MYKKRLSSKRINNLERSNDDIILYRNDRKLESYLTYKKTNDDYDNENDDKKINEGIYNNSNSYSPKNSKDYEIDESSKKNNNEEYKSVKEKKNIYKIYEKELKDKKKK